MENEFMARIKASEIKEFLFGSANEKVFPTEKKIGRWLKAIGRGWKSDTPNRFTNNRLEALYLYKDHIKYWEDIRAKSVVVQLDFPISKNQFIELIGPRDWTR